MWVKLTAEQKADIINQYKSWDKEGALAMAKSINSGTTTPPTTTQTTTTKTTPTQTTQTTQTTPTTYTNKSEYGGQWGIANQKTVPQDNPYVNQGNGQYNYDNKSWYYVSNQTSPSSTTTSNIDSIRSKWESMSYEDQQKALKNIPNLQSALEKYWITNKQQNTQTQFKQSSREDQWDGKYEYNDKTEYYERVDGKWDGWDYQDNSPERMAQILDNLNNLSKTNPWLFANYDAFYNAFIAGKGRSPEQEALLNDYFNNMKKYNQYDNMSSDAIGQWLVNWTVSEDYLNYVKYADPQRYAEIQEARKRGEDTIKSDAFMDTINSIDGWADYTSQTSKVIEWLKWQWLLVDKDWNLIDDRTENYANDEELGYQKQIADLNARNLEIDMIMKNTYDDYKEKYPWATKAELMAMAQDTNNDLLREKEDNLVQLTRLQWYVWYMQAERQERDAVWQNAINQLQKQYGMYYQYSPQWMSELAQAQYAATNVTLDQADSWTDTQKQMALESVLSPIYEQYSAIIQRPMAQVINDVIAYAKNNWVSLSKALEDNFMTPLKSKQAYKNIQAQLNATWSNNDITWTKIWTDAEWNDIYWFVDSTNMTVTPFGDVWWTQSYSYTAEWVSKDRWERQSFMSDIADKYSTIEEMANAIAWNMNWLWDGNLECWQYVNDYIYWVTWEQGKFWNDVSQKESICDNRDKAWVKVWDAIVFNWNKNEPQRVKNSTERADLLKYWHVWYVTWIDDQWNVTMSHTVWGNVTTTTFNLYGNNDYANNFSWSQTVTPKQTSGWMWKWVAVLDGLNPNIKNNSKNNATYAFARRAWNADEKIRDIEKLYEWIRDSQSIKAADRLTRFYWQSAKSKAQKDYEAYRNEFVNAALRRESWAAIGVTEFSDDEKWAIQRYFPQPWDDKETIALKQALRENYIETMFSTAWKAADWRTYQEIYQQNAIHNFANEEWEPLWTNSDYYDWQAAAASMGWK